MTNTNFTLDDLSFDVLFNNGTCLTFNALRGLDNFKYAQDLRADYNKKHKNKNTFIETIAPLNSDSYHSNFHYFSNGVLIHNLTNTQSNDNSALKRVLKMLEIRKLPVNKIYDLSKVYNSINASSYMDKLEAFAQTFYSIQDTIKIIELPSIENFVKECFANGNVLLTACKNEDIDPDIRDNIALFADGRYYISTNIAYIDSFTKRSILKKEHSDFVFLASNHIPQSYLTALYDEAKNHSWYISKEEQKQKYNPSSNKIEEINQYIEKLFNNRKCLSVTNIEYGHPLSYFSACPDTDKYALFSDGLLLISNKSPKNEAWIENIRKIYKDLEIKVNLVPDFYISSIYSNLAQYQRSATDIYIEMLKERAKKIKKELKIAHHIALEVVAKAEHWKNYKSIKIENETHARYYISHFICGIKSIQLYMDIYKSYLKEKGGNNE